MDTAERDRLVDRIAALIERATVEAKHDNWIGAMVYLREAREIAELLERA